MKKDSSQPSNRASSAELKSERRRQGSEGRLRKDERLLQSIHPSHVRRCRITADKTAVAQIDLTKVKPYGDTLNDGMTEVAFHFCTLR